MVRFAGKATGSGLPKENNIAAPSSQYHIAQYIYYNVDIAEDIEICYNMLAHSLLIMREVLNLTLSMFTALYFLVGTGNRNDIT